MDTDEPRTWGQDDFDEDQLQIPFSMSAGIVIIYPESKGFRGDASMADRGGVTSQASKRRVDSETRLFDWSS